MSFSPQGHRSVAWGNLAYLGLFVVVLYNMPLQPATVVTSQLESLLTLTYDEKMNLIANRTQNETGVRIPMQLHFTNHRVDLAPFVVMVGLLITVYSLLSAAWLHGVDGRELVGSIPFSLATVGSDATSMMMDMIFWVLFAVFHGFVYVWLTGFCLQESLVLYALVVTGTTWMLANRVVTSYVPAIVSAGFFLCVVHGDAVVDVMECEANQWLVYFVLFMMDGMLLVGHMFDEDMVVEVVLNCRIVYVCTIGMYMSMLVLFT